MYINVLENRNVYIDVVGTQNENRTDTIKIKVPEKYEEFNKKIVFITPDEVMWDEIQNNEYEITNAITKYKDVQFYIWLTKDNVDFRSKTRTIEFNTNKDASKEINSEEINGVNTVINLLESEITKVNELETKLTELINDTQNKLNSGYFKGEKGQDGYTPKKGVDYYTQEDKEELENIIYEKTKEDISSKVDKISGKSLSTNDFTNEYRDKLDNLNNYDDTEIKSEVSKKVDKVEGKGLSSNDFTTEEKEKLAKLSNYDDTEIRNEVSNKVEKVAGKMLSSNDFTNKYKNKLDSLNNYDDTQLKEEISQKASKAYVDDIVGDIDKLLDSINGEVI